MNILIYEHNHFGIDDLKEVLTKMGHSFKLVSNYDLSERKDSKFEKEFFKLYEEGKYDFVFTFNYYPIVSNCCQKINKPYLCLIYDSPHINTYSYTLINSCNHVFTFDSADFFFFRDRGINTINYIPLPVNTSRLERQTKLPNPHFASDISFVGALYNEKHNFYERLVDSKISDYTKGFLEGIMAAQEHIYGNFLLESLICGPILDDMMDKMPAKPNADGVETSSYIYANYFLSRKITSNERMHILEKLDKTLASKYKVNLYTHTPPKNLKHINCYGAIDYINDMPQVFKNSKINLNITLKSIKTGMPLRCIDILGSNGFLLTNYQEDILRHFTDGVDLVIYEDYDDLIRKCDYYLEHDNKREEISHNGFMKVSKNHSYEKVLNTMFNSL